MTDISEVEAVPNQASLEGLEQARERQLEAIRSQYSQRISILEKERDSRLQGVERRIGLAGDRAQWLVKRYTSRTVRCTLDDP